MAREIECDVCRQEPAVIMQTDMRNGSTVAVGEQCLMPWAIKTAAEVGLVALPAELVPVELGGTAVPPDDVPEVPPKAHKGRRRSAEPSATARERADKYAEGLDAQLRVVTLVGGVEPDTDEVTDEPTDEPAVAALDDAEVSA